MTCGNFLRYPDNSIIVAPVVVVTDPDKPLESRHDNYFLWSYKIVAHFRPPEITQGSTGRNEHITSGNPVIIYLDSVT